MQESFSGARAYPVTISGHINFDDQLGRYRYFLIASDLKCVAKL